MDRDTGAIMRVTINTACRVAYFNGAAHDLSRMGVNRLMAWLQDNGRLLWGWSGAGEFVYEVTP